MKNRNLNAALAATLIVASVSLPLRAAEPAPATSPAPAPLVFPQGEAFRAKQPAPAAPRAMKAPVPQRFRLANGVEVFLVEKHTLPTVSMSISFDGGSSGDPKGKEGLASQSMALLGTGSEKLDRIALAEALGDIGSELNARAGLEQLSVSVDSLSKNLDRSLDLWSDLLLHPGLRADELARNVKQGLASVKKAKGAPGSLAQRLRGEVAWGADHPYGRIVTEGSLGAITLDDCRRYLAERIRPTGARLFVVGDVTKAQLEEKLGARLASWKGAPPAAVKPGPAAPLKGRLFLVDVPKAPQSSVAVLHDGPRRDAADYVPTELVASILGGGFASRINMNIREKNGWAYGAYGGFDYVRGGSTFSAGGSVKGDATAPALGEILKEIDGIRSATVTDEEIAREKASRTQGLPARWATGSSTLRTFAELSDQGLPLDWYDGYPAKVEKATKEDLLAAAKAHLRPAEARILVVGDLATILPKLKELAASKGIAEADIVRLDADGRIAESAPAPAAAK